MEFTTPSANGGQSQPLRTRRDKMNSTDKARRATVPRVHRKSAIIVGLALGVVLSVVGVVVWIAIRNRDPIPPLTEADFEIARAKWKTNGPASYDVDLILGGQRIGHGDQNDTVRVEVRHGVVRSMTRNNYKPKDPRTWDFWTIPAQFETIRRDLDAVRDPTLLNQAPGTQILLFADLDPKYGFARRYERQVLGTSADMQWRVIRFVADPDAE